MKIKKLAALALSCAMVISGGALFAACGDDDKKEEEKGSFVEDTRIWYAVGSSEKGTLKDNGSWKPQNAAETLTFKRDTTKTDENVFTLKMDIYAGDGFKFVYKTKADETFSSDDEIWARQVGIHNFTNVEGEGADAVIKIGEDTVFTTRDGIDANNLYCAKGQDGKYTITLKTFPDKGAQEKVEFSVVKDEAIKIPYDMYVYGDMNDFGWKNKADFAMNASNGVWSYKLTVAADDLKRDATGKKVGKDETASYAAVQLVNEGEGAAAGDAKKFALAPAAGDNFLKVNDTTNGEVNLLPEGKWVITFTEDGKIVSITESAYEMYFRGSGTGMSWSDCLDAYKLTEGGDGAYWTGNLTVTQEDITKNGKVEFKIFNKLDKTGGGWYGIDGNNVELTEAGVYGVKFVVETGEITFDKCAYYIVGGYTDPSWGDGLTSGKSVKLTETATAGTYSGEVTLKSGVEFKVVFGSVAGGPITWYGAGENGADPNFKATEDATYVVTVVVTDGNISSATFAKKA